MTSQRLRRILHLTAAGLLAATVALSGRALAQGTGPATTEAPPPAALPVDGDTVPLAAFGFTDSTVRGPFGSKRLLFSLPADWALTSGAELHLDLSVFLNGQTSPANADSGTPLPPAQPFGGLLEVRFNDVALEPIALDSSGPRTVVLPVPNAALVSRHSQGRHALQFALNTGIGCADGEPQPSVVLHDTSALRLPHQVSAPATDLRLLPRPIFQDSFALEGAVLVVPDAPTPVELQSALIVAAGLGRMTDGKLAVSLTSVSQLPAAAYDNHLLFVGRPAAFPMLDLVPLPAPRSEAGFPAASSVPEDGVVQSAVSPWNGGRVVVAIGGGSDAGVLKASQAFASSGLQVNNNPGLAVVTEVEPVPPMDAIPVDRTLADLGYGANTVDDTGSNFMDYEFVLPTDQSAGSDAYVELLFNHSALLDYERSGLIVSLNGQPIGSARFDDNTGTQGALRLNLPSFALHPGNNTLTLQANLAPRSACLDPRQNQLWLTIFPGSSLHLPLAPAQGALTSRLDMSQYPSPFAFSPALQDLAFVLPANAPAAWDVAAQIAEDLGREAGVLVPNFGVAFADAAPDEMRQGRHLIVIGRPSTLPMLAEIRDRLPAPFAEGADVVTERTTRVAYRLPDGASVGYLQLAASPWNPDRALLAVLGNSDEGLRWAGNALILPVLRRQVRGTFAVINGDQVVAETIRPGPTARNLAATAVPGGQPQPAPFRAVGFSQRPTWMLALLGVSALLMIVIALGVLISAGRGRRSTG